MNPRVLAAVGATAVALVIGASFVFGGDSDPAPAAANPSVPATSSSVGDAPAPTTAPTPDLPNRGPHPELLEIDGWLQSDVTSLEELRGKVVAVQFWTFACRNCRATIPHMQELHERYGNQDFEIVGIHAPEFDYEAEVPNIEEAAAELGVTWPIVLDTKKRTFHSWQEGPTAHWPRIYLLDRDGNIRYDHIGEGRYAETDAAVQALLAEPS
ncbi:MAG TPA: redoxin domain-containing protein [Ilumatobacteraceae bacterium]|jgi:thiol-disulfide isomerase/thioredoxin|nr:redoxin domain-containing protein [Ilumatobacteraceae bacterium]